MMAAGRTLHIKRENGTTALPITIAVPRYNRTGWSCSFGIGWPEGQQIGHAFARDGVQALYTAMQMIGSALYTSTYHTSGVLFASEPGQGYGFPLPLGSRDKAVGLDKGL